jgi:phosphatidate phosphatase APP1
MVGTRASEQFPNRFLLILRDVLGILHETTEDRKSMESTVKVAEPPRLQAKVAQASRLRTLFVVQALACCS